MAFIERKNVSMPRASHAKIATFDHSLVGTSTGGRFLDLTQSGQLEIRKSFLIRLHLDRNTNRTSLLRSIVRVLGESPSEPGNQLLTNIFIARTDANHPLVVEINQGPRPSRNMPFLPSIVDNEIGSHYHCALDIFNAEFLSLACQIGTAVNHQLAMGIIQPSEFSLEWPFRDRDAESSALGDSFQVWDQLPSGLFHLRDHSDCYPAIFGKSPGDGELPR